MEKKVSFEEFILSNKEIPFGEGYVPNGSGLSKPPKATPKPNSDNKDKK